ncbi:PREDICTED: cadherin-87A [Papilio xuthus]|uniref:Cadherin-87A n=1 Tax=Papilio xuthus TaxID=66420 RepID=A0AAJ6Z8R0_PAPXU|nr:PREDICTED: cadherin-87A [Papilio xuthus]
MARWHCVVLFATLCICTGSSNKLPGFAGDVDNLALSESTPVGQVVHTLNGTDPEGLPVKYDLVGTNKFSVNPDTGEITLIQPLDREREDTIKFLVSVQDQDPEGVLNLTHNQPMTVIVLDENDNPPIFKNSPYEVDVAEDEEVGKTILTNIKVEDLDSVGDSLEVGCEPSEQWPQACEVFEVTSLHSTANQYTGALVLKKKLDYNENQFYQFQLYATDGSLNSSAPVEVKVVDVQNSPPVFSGALSGALPEDAPVGTVALTVRARDADRAQPRDVKLDLITNPLDFFWLDSNTGELKTARPLDREALADPNSPLNLTVRATELVNGIPVVSNITSTLATVTVTIRDVNDEPPRFNRREYHVDIPESLPVGTPLPNLDMVVTDTDVGSNSVFSLRLSDEMGAFVVEPATATGSATVTLRLNTSLDYEDPNQRKFILEVIAEEVHTSPKLSSKASVTVSLWDVNDNAPHFPDEPHAASVPEAAPPGTRVTALRATDRDTGRYGTEGIVYELSGSGAELFRVDSRSGVISVAECATPGTPPCLDYETRKDYFLQYKATDEDGNGQTTVASLQLSLSDSNDNAPVFLTPVYKASIDEDAVKFEPELQVQARDVDVSSDIRYSIIYPPRNPFWIDPQSGKIAVRGEITSVNSTDNNLIVLTVLATDGVHNATCSVEVTVRDVNNHAPTFDTDKYDADVTEDAPIGTEVAAVRATDLDSGINSQFTYAVQKGALDSFSVHPHTGVVTVSAKLDYDKRNTYRIQIIATDMGIPSLTGTTELTVHVINVNDKKPVFTPSVQRAEVSADAEVGTVLHKLVAVDPDITDHSQLLFEISQETPIRAVDTNGNEVVDVGALVSWFSVLSAGEVVVAGGLRRNMAAVVTLPVQVTDTSAPSLQRSYGEVIITIVDVNRYGPVFTEPAYLESVLEEQPVGTVLNTYTATDRETPIASILIYPPSPYFHIDNVTGVVKIAQRIDYEQVKHLNFTLVAYDSGVPQRSTPAAVSIDVVNVNDEEPVFAAAEYDAAVLENADAATSVLTVTALDKDEGEFGEVSYNITGELSNLFKIDTNTGVISVAEGAVIDRENITDIYLRAVATDNAPPQIRKTTSVPVHIKVIDENDNAPVFSQKVYKSTIAENLQLEPPAAILQVLAEDRDEGINGKVQYSIEEQSEPDTFRVEPTNGIIYPAKAVRGNATYQVTVRADDGRYTARARVHIAVLSVNRHSPVFVHPPPDQRQIEIPENAAQADYLITTIKATDADSGENGRVSYYLKVDNRNVRDTPEFSLDTDTGELRTKTFLDREHKAEYQLVIAAVDNGTPAQFESLRLLTVVLADDDDNTPRFTQRHYQFTLAENLSPGIIVGSVKAIDKDSGDNGKVYYHVLEGNREGAFTLDRTQGILRANTSFDREKQDEYTMTIYASNNPILEHAAAILNSIDNSTDSQDGSVATLGVTILDENDNEPKFGQDVYYAGIKQTARINEPIISVAASDPDLRENGTLVYVVAASHLYKFGAARSSGSVVPSPFNITQDGVLMTAAFMSEYNQDRFVLDVIAQELAPPHRRATAKVYLWIIERSSLIRLVVSRSCAASAGGVRERLQAAGGALLVPGRRLPLVQADRLHDDWCEIHLHAVDPATYEVLPVERVLQAIDGKYDQLKDVYQEFGVETLVAASAAAQPDTFDPALAALIALLIVLFTGIVTFVVVCACLKHWVIPPPSLQSSKGDSLARRRILEELSTTENPLWLETKLRPYEEQELTMNVFGDQPETAVDQPQTDNTYATIQGSRATERFGDYATLGGDSPTPLEAALGFQGSTFKPPSPDTPEPPPRPSALGPLSLS